MRQSGLMRPSLAVCNTAALVALLAGCAKKAGTEEPAPSPLIAYQPHEAFYVGVTHGQVEQTFNNQVAESEFSLAYYLTVVVMGEQDALRVTLTIDSIAAVTGFPGGSLDARIDSSVGAEFTAGLGENGALQDFSGGESSGSLVQELADRVLEQFFPLIPATGVGPGMEWTDTLTSEATVGGVKNTVQTVNHSSSIEWTTYGGERALHIETVSDYTFSGSGVQAGQDFSLDGQGRRHSHQYLSERGIYLGLVSADTAHAEAQLTDAGITIPVQQIRADTLSITKDTLAIAR
jgi:hypothetical protein